MVEFNLEMHLAIIDYGKTFDSLDRNLLWRIMLCRGCFKSLSPGCEMHNYKILQKYYWPMGIK